MKPTTEARIVGWLYRLCVMIAGPLR